MQEEYGMEEDTTAELLLNLNYKIRTASVEYL